MPKSAGLLAILGGAPKGESAEGGEVPAEAGGKEMALRDMFSAMKSGDFSAAAEAFQRAYDECSMSPVSEEE